MKTIEKILNFILWAIHDIGRAIKHNPLTEAWRKIPVSDYGSLSEPAKELIKGLRAEKIICEEKTGRKPAGEMIFQSEKQKVQRTSGGLSRRELMNRMSPEQKAGWQRLSNDIKKNGSVKVCEFGQKQ